MQRTSTGSGTGSPGGTSTDGGGGGRNTDTDVSGPTQGDSGNGDEPGDASSFGEPTVPWQYPVTAAIMTGTLSAENGHVILRTLDAVSETCSAEVRRAAATELVDYATGQQGLGATLHEDLLRRARQVRDRIDPDGIAERYTQRYERRSLKTWHDRDGALNLHAVCDDDSGVFLTQLFDLALSPRRGGPRFTTKDDVAWAQRLLDDPRSNEQLAFDTLLTVLHDGAACDASTTFRGDRPAVRVITVINTNDTDTTDTAATGTATTGTDRGGVEQHDQSGTPASVAARNTGNDADRRDQQHGQLEGSAFALPRTVVEATVCTDGVVPITVDRSGRALNLGRTRRLFSPAQRVILRARDGGCLWPGCTDHPGKPKPTTSTTTPNTTAKPTSPTASEPSRV